MGTRSNITLKTEEGFKTIYGHWDGHLETMGKTLFESFNTQEKAESLLALGDLSALYSSIEKPEGHTFEKPEKGYSIFYGRDRGDKDSEAKTFKTLKELQNHWRDSWTEFSYIFKNGAWHYTEANFISSRPAKLTEKLFA